MNINHTDYYFHQFNRTTSLRNDSVFEISDESVPCEAEEVSSNRDYGVAFVIDDTHHTAGEPQQIAGVFNGKSWCEKGEGQFQGCER